MEYTVSLDKVIQRFNLKVICITEQVKTILICNNNINRPGLQLAGFYDYFDADRIQIFGKGEMAFLKGFSEEEQRIKLEDFFMLKPVVAIITRGIEVPAFMCEIARKNGVPLLYTEESTPEFTADLISFLNVELAPRIVRHGVFIEVYGEGVFITGNSGVGKSETAVELIKRGHRLIADDAVELRKVSSTTIVGSSPNNIRYFMELRGIGVINASRLFGTGAIKLTQSVDLVVEMEPWNKEQEYDRLGLDQKTYDILGVTRPSVLIPVNPGRNLSVIIEVAAMNNRQRRMGYNAAQDLMDNLANEANGSIEEIDVYNLEYEEN